MRARPAEKTGALVISRDIIKTVFDSLLVEVLQQIGGLMAQGHKHTSMILYGTEPKMESILGLLKNYGKNAQGFKITHTVKDRDFQILLNHNMGINWNVFVEAYVKNYIIEMLDIPVRSHYTEGTVVIECRV